MAALSKQTAEDVSMQSSSLPSTPRVRNTNKIQKKTNQVSLFQKKANDQS